MKLLTVVVKYEDNQEQPSFHANMECLGGIVTGVQFNDALAEIEALEKEKQEMLDAPGDLC